MPMPMMATSCGVRVKRLKSYHKHDWVLKVFKAASIEVEEMERFRRMRAEPASRSKLYSAFHIHSTIKCVRASVW